MRGRVAAGVMTLGGIGLRARLGLGARVSPWLCRVALALSSICFGAGCVIPKLGEIVVDAGSDAGSHVVQAGEGGAADDGGASGMGGGPEHPLGGRGGAGSGGMRSQSGGVGGAGAGGMAGIGGAGMAGSTTLVGAGGGPVAAVSGAGGAAGSPGPVACVLDWGSTRTKDSDFMDLPSNPGSETNSQGIVKQYVCRAAPSGMSQLAIGKAVPGYGCYGTYASGSMRIGFGVEGDFHVLAGITGCTARWDALPSARAPIELGVSAGLYACRGKLMDEPYPSGTASGTELGQWVRSQGNPDVYECWTQFHGSDMGQDAGRQLLTMEVEVLVRDP